MITARKEVSNMGNIELKILITTEYAHPHYSGTNTECREFKDLSKAENYYSIKIDEDKKSKGYQHTSMNLVYFRKG
jgi:hypothetical protein